MKTPLGTELDLRAGHIVLDGLPALCERGTAPPPSCVADIQTAFTWFCKC